MKAIAPLILVALIAFTACKKKSSDPEPDPAPTTTTTTGTTGSTPSVDVNSTPRVSYLLDSTAVSYVTDEVTYFTGSGSSGSLSYTYDSNISNGGSKVYFNITKGTVSTGGGPLSDSAFKAFFPVASIPYSTNAASGVEVSIWDANDVQWSTSFGTGDQTGSTFKIVQIKDEQQGDLYIKTYINFSCKVYNAAGIMKIITHGKYVGHFGNL